MELSRLVRTAWAAFSSIPMRSEAWWMTMGRSSSSRCSSSRSRSSGSGPIRWTRTGSVAAGEDGSANLRLGSLVGTNGVKRDVGEHLGCELLCFLHVQHGAALVRSALGAGAMGQLLFVAVGALREARTR